jgi:ribosome-binding factor A
MRRPEVFAEALREEIMEIVGFELEDPRIQSATVTEVRLSDNRRDAKVFILVEGEENEIRETMKALHHAEKFVRQQVALRLNLRHAPQIHFVRDTVEEQARRIDQILEEIKENSPESPESPESRESEEISS